MRKGDEDTIMVIKTGSSGIIYVIVSVDETYKEYIVNDVTEKHEHVICTVT